MPGQRDVKEFATIGRLYPDIKHVFVEGATDARYVAVAASFPENCDVHSADDVSLPDDRDDGEENSPFLSGNRLKLVRISRHMVAVARADNSRYLIDKDFEDLVRVIPNERWFVLTDFANLFVGELAFEWVREGVYRATGARLTRDHWTAILAACRFMYAFRYLKQRDYSRAATPNVENFVHALKEGWVFDEALYCAQAVTSPDIPLTAAQLRERIAQLEIDTQADVREVINSGDLFNLLYNVVKSERLAANVARQNLRSAVLVSCPLPSSDQPRLQALLGWMAG